MNIPRILSLCPLHRNANDDSTLYEKGHYRRAHTVLNKRLKEDKRLSQIGDVYTRLADLELLVKGNPSKALKLLDRASELGYEMSGYYFVTRAQALGQLGHLEEALLHYQEAVEADGHPYTLSNYAEALSFHNDKRAINVWKRLLRLNEKDYNYLACSFICIEARKSADLESVNEMTQKIEDAVPTASHAFNLGLYYHRQLNEYALALNQYTLAEKLGHPNRASLFTAVSDCYSSLSDQRNATRYARKARFIRFMEWD